MLTVMIVDDDPLLCTAMRRKIEMIDRENQLGIQETLIAHSAQEAWGILQEKSVDILISDIRMPYQTGLELADKVNEAFPEIQVVILSGHDDYEYMRSALRSGVVDYLLKPVKLVQIQEVLLKCQENLRRRKAQSLRNGNDREALENWLNGLLAGKTGKPPVEFPHPVFWVAWPFGGEEESETECKRGEMEQAFETAAFNLKTGETSSIVEAGGKYYIIRCTSDNEKSKTEANKTALMDEKKLEYFNSVFESYEASKYVEMNKKVWNSKKTANATELPVSFETVFNELVK